MLQSPLLAHSFLFHCSHCSPTSQAIREMQTKTALGFYLIPVLMVIIMETKDQMQLKKVN